MSRQLHGRHLGFSGVLGWFVQQSCTRDPFWLDEVVFPFVGVREAVNLGRSPSPVSGLSALHRFDPFLSVRRTVLQPSPRLVAISPPAVGDRAWFATRARQHIRAQGFYVVTFLLCCDDCMVDRVVALSFSPLQSSREFRALGSQGVSETSRGCLCRHPLQKFLKPLGQHLDLCALC